MTRLSCLRQRVHNRRGGAAFSAPAFFFKLAPSMLVRALFASGFLLFCVPAASAAEDSAIRQKLAQTILMQGPEQQKLFEELAESGAKVVRDVLNAWSRDGLFLYDAPDGSKVPVLLEEQQDAEGKVRAIRVLDGQFVK